MKEHNCFGQLLGFRACIILIGFFMAMASNIKTTSVRFGVIELFSVAKTLDKNPGWQFLDNVNFLIVHGCGKFRNFLK